MWNTEKVESGGQMTKGINITSLKGNLVKCIKMCILMYAFQYGNSI